MARSTAVRRVILGGCAMVAIAAVGLAVLQQITSDRDAQATAIPAAQATPKASTPPTTTTPTPTTIPTTTPDSSGLLPANQVDFSVAVNAFSDQIFALGAKYPDAFSTFVVAGETASVEIGISQFAPEDQRSGLITEATAILSQYPVSFTFPDKPTALAPLQSVVDEIGADASIWAPRFGGQNFVMGADPETGVVNVTSEGPPDPEWSDFVYNGVRVIVTSADGPVVSLGLAE